MFQDDDLSMIAAQQYYIEYGSDINKERLQSLLHSYIPDRVLKRTGGLTHWMQQVMSKLRLDYFANNKIETMKVKGDIVSFAKNKWPMLFSRFYEAFKLAGPSLPKNDVLIVVNWTGFYVHDDQEHVLFDVSFPEIAAVSSSRYGDISFYYILVVYYSKKALKCRYLRLVYVLRRGGKIITLVKNNPGCACNYRATCQDKKEISCHRSNRKEIYQTLYKSNPGMTIVTNFHQKQFCILNILI